MRRNQDTAAIEYLGFATLSAETVRELEATHREACKRGVEHFIPCDCTPYERGQTYGRVWVPVMTMRLEHAQSHLFWLLSVRCGLSRKPYLGSIANVGWRLGFGTNPDIIQLR